MGLGGGQVEGVGEGEEHLLEAAQDQQIGRLRLQGEKTPEK